MIPTRTGKTGEHFPFREKSGNFAKMGKVGVFYPKYWENQKKKLHWKFGKNTGKVGGIVSQ